MVWKQKGSLRGPKGDAGQRGETGPAGPPGPAGDPKTWQDLLPAGGVPAGDLATDVQNTLNDVATKLPASDAPNNGTPVALKLVRRTSSADIQVPEQPGHNLYAASKKYVDDAVAAAGGSASGPPSWNTTSGMALRDNGNINVGSGGSFAFRWRVDRGLFQAWWWIKWGDRASSGGGPVRIMLPHRPAGGMEVTGSGSYWSQGGLFSMVTNPVVRPGSNEMVFPINKNGGDNTQLEFQIWDGRNGAQTGVPFNPGFSLDQRDSNLKGNITFPI